jgi:hypothetical protein
MNVIKNLLNPKNSNEITLEYWEIYISEGVEAACKGRFHKIIEIYVPELELVINQALKPLNVFQSKKDRYKTKNSDMSGQPAKLIKTVVVTGEKMETLKWLAKIQKEQKEKKETLVNLFKD